MGLSEKMAERRMKAEQKKVERQLKNTSGSARELVQKIQSEPGQLNLDTMVMLAKEFGPNGQNNELVEAVLSKPKNKIMYAIVKEHFEGEWMAEFERLVDVIPAQEKVRAHKFTWDEWRGYADAAALNEEGLKQALHVVVVFRGAAGGAKGQRR